MEAFLAFAIFAAIIVAISIAITRARRRALMEKYHDAALVERIMRKEVWQGMTQMQLIDSWGRPAATDEKVYKTKITHTFKYGESGRNRFHRRVRVENGIVVGWEQK